AVAVDRAVVRRSRYVVSALVTPSTVQAGRSLAAQPSLAACWFCHSAASEDRTGERSARRAGIIRASATTANVTAAATASSATGTTNRIGSPPDAAVRAISPVDSTVATTPMDIAAAASITASAEAAPRI